MMNWTDRHCRFFHRLLSRRALLYTEMLTAEAIIHGKRDRLLGFSAQEHPLALQLGGADPQRLAQAASIAADFGYDEINLNVGCPSERVQSGRFGACLMAEPDLVARCVEAMAAAVPASVPLTVKCRIGIDDQDSERDLERFISTVAAAGCQRFIVHARKAWLKGLSAKDNRDVPPLDYARVHRLKARHEGLTIVLNGALATLEEAAGHLVQGDDASAAGVAGTAGSDGGDELAGSCGAAGDAGTAQVALDGVMLGRAVYHNPYLLADVDRAFFAAVQSPPARRDIMLQLIGYAERHIRSGGGLNHITRHILGLYGGRPRARAFRRCLSERAWREDAGIDVLHEALAIAEGVSPLRRTA